MLNHRICITPSVLSELKPWSCNTPFRRLLWDSIKGERCSPSRINVLTAEWIQCLPSFRHYLSLLTYRKEVGVLAVGELASRLGRLPKDDEIQACLQQRFGPRGYALAKKGWDERSKQNRFADEELVVSSVLSAITTGREVIIVTFDTDVFDQFAKLAHLLSDDYRSMLVADRFVLDPFRWAPRMSNSAILGLKLRYSDVWDVMPNCPFTNVYCMLLGNDFSNLRISNAENQLSP